MSLSPVASGAWAAASSTSTAAAPALPAGWQQGDLLILTVVWKQTGATFTTPANWTLLGTATCTNATSYGAGAGASKVAMFSLVAAIGQTAPTLSALTGGSTNSTQGNIMMASISAFRSATGSYDVVATTEDQATSTTSWSTTMAADPGLESGDMVMAGMGMALSTATQTNHNVTATGATIGARTVAPTKGSSTIGADLGATTYYASVTAGPSTAAPVVSLTQSAATYGAVMLVRIRENRYLRFDVETATPSGTTLTPANTGLSAVTLSGAGAAATSDNTAGRVAQGALSALLHPVSGGSNQLTFSFRTSAFAIRIGFYLTAGASADHFMTALYTAATTRLVSLHLTSLSRMRLDSAIGTGSPGIGNDTNTFRLDEYVYLNLFVIPGTTTTNGTVRATMDSGNSDDPFWDTGMLTSQNTGTAGFVDTVRFGKPLTSGTYATDFWVDDVTVDLLATDIIEASIPEVVPFIGWGQPIV